MKTIPIRDLVARMSFGIYHATSIERYRGIRDLGRILPGNEVDHKNFPQSKCSNCYELGAVSCFDFENADQPEVFGDDSMQKWPRVLLSYRFSQFATVVLIGFDRSDLPQKPLYYPEIKKRLGFGGIIPYGIECCYPGTMELALARHVILVCHWNQIILELKSVDCPVIADAQLDDIGRAHKVLAEQYRRTIQNER